MRRILNLAALATVTLISGAGAAAASSPTPTPVSRVGNPGALVAGSFNSSHVQGTATFLQTRDRSTVYVNGAYRNLDRNRPYFAVAYDNSDCDPAKAFSVGPFISDKNGRAILAAGVSSDFNGPPVNLAGSGSVSIRYGDEDKNGTYTDQDHDGIWGGGDVVAVPGKPKIGLVGCDKRPHDVTVAP